MCPRTYWHKYRAQGRPLQPPTGDEGNEGKRGERRETKETGKSGKRGLRSLTEYICVRRLCHETHIYYTSLLFPLCVTYICSAAMTRSTYILHNFSVFTHQTQICYTASPFCAYATYFRYTPSPAVAAKHIYITRLSTPTKICSETICKHFVT